MSKFTTDTMTVSRNDPVSGLLRNMLILRDGGPIKCLEIGVYEGCHACWLLENVLTHPDSEYIGIDSWVCDNPDARATAAENLKQYGDKACLIAGDSRVVLRPIPRADKKYDLIIVDGDHSFEVCLLDAFNCWRLLKKGGLIVYDDVMRDDYGVAKAIHQHLSSLASTSYRILHWHYRVAIEKLA